MYEDNVECVVSCSEMNGRDECWARWGLRVCLLVRCVGEMICVRGGGKLESSVLELQQVHQQVLSTHGIHFRNV